MGNVNQCFKGVDLGVIFRNILLENNKIINVVDIFYISHKNSFKNFIFLLWFINKGHVNECP